MILNATGAVVSNDWVVLSDDAPIPDQTAVILSLTRWQTERDTLVSGRCPLGVWLKGDQHVEALAADLGRLDMIAVEFGRFRDGRGFTAARRLRERYAYAGEIRAVGHVLPDQYAFLLRCGFSQVTIPEQVDPAVWQAARTAITVAYQASVSDPINESPLRRLLTRQSDKEQA